MKVKKHLLCNASSWASRLSTDSYSMIAIAVNHYCSKKYPQKNDNSLVSIVFIFLNMKVIVVIFVDEPLGLRF